MNPTLNTQNPKPLSEGELWIPSAILKNLPHGRPVVLSAHLSEGERIVLRRKKPIRPSVWSERHRIVTMSSFPGPWRNDLTPHLVGIMDAGAMPFVREIIICKPPQTGGSEAVNNFIGSRIDRDPGPALYVYPDRDTARDNSKDRILPMITSSPRLKQYLTGYDEDEASMRIKLKHMPIYMAWSGSASRLGNRPIKHLVLDEIDKYKRHMVKNETDAIRLAEKRVITYLYDHKIWKISTPTIESGPITKAMKNEAQVIFDYWVKCPECGEYQIMIFDRIKWDKEIGEDGKPVHPTPQRMNSKTPSKRR